MENKRTKVRTNPDFPKSELHGCLPVACALFLEMMEADVGATVLVGFGVPSVVGGQNAAHLFLAPSSPAPLPPDPAGAISCLLLRLKSLLLQDFRFQDLSPDLAGERLQLISTGENLSSSRPGSWKPWWESVRVILCHAVPVT